MSTTFRGVALPDVLPPIDITSNQAVEIAKAFHSEYGSQIAHKAEWHADHGLILHFAGRPDNVAGIHLGTLKDDDAVVDDFIKILELFEFDWKEHYAQQLIANDPASPSTDTYVFFTKESPALATNTA